MAKIEVLLGGSRNDLDEAPLTDREQLNQIHEVEQLPKEKKAIVKELLDSFLLKYDIQNRMA